MATELATAYISIVPSMKGFAKSMTPGFKGIEDEAAKTGEKSGGLFTSKFGAAGVLAAAAAGVAIGAAVSSAIGSALNIDKANDKLAAQLGLTAKESESAGKVAGSLYSGAYGESIEEVNGAVGAVMSSIKGMRTASSADVEAMTAKVLDLSAAFEIDAGRAAQVAGQMITSGLAEDGVQAADLLTAALQKVPAAVREDILDAADEYGPFFSNLGISGEQAMGMLVESSEKGMYGIDKTGDALKEFGIRATDMSKASGEAYETLGIDQTEMTNALLAGGDSAAGAFQDIVGGLQGIEDPSARSQAALALFGAPLEDLSVTEIPKFLESLSTTAGGLGDVAGAAEAMGDTLNDNAATKIEGFKRTVETAVVGFFADKVLPIFEEVIGGVMAFAAAWKYNDGEITSSGFPGFMERIGYWARQAFDYFNTTVLPVLQDFAGYITGTVVPAIQSFIQWLKDNKETIGDVATVITVIMLPTLVRLGITALVSAAKQVKAWVMTQVAAIKTGAVYVAQSILMIGRWAWMGVQSLFHAGRMAAAWLIAMGPVGWVIAAVIGLAALIIANWDKIVKFTKDAWSAMSKWISDTWNNIKTAISLAIVWVAGWIRTKMDELKRNWETVWGAVKTTVSTIWEGIKTVVSNAWTNLKNTFTTLIDFVKTSIPKAFEAARDGIGKAWSAIQELAKKPVRFVVNTVIGGLVDTFNKIPGVNIKKPKLPRGFAKGGYATPGWAMVGEEGPELVNFSNPGRVYTAKETATALNHGGAQALGAPMGGSEPFIWGGPQQAAKRSGFMDFRALGGFPTGILQQAASAWRGLSGLGITAGHYRDKPSHGVDNSISAYYGAMPQPNWAGYYQDQSILVKQGSRSGDLGVLVHEIGHALGIHHNTGNRSVMNPTLGATGAMYNPTGYDASNLRRLYGSPKSGAKTTTDFGGGGGSFDDKPENPFNGMVDLLIGKLKGAFPGGGMFLDAAGGIAKSGIESVIKMVSDVANNVKNLVSDITGNVLSGIKNFFGGGAAASPALYDTGGWLMPNGGRPQLVQNKTGKPEAIFTPDQLRARATDQRQPVEVHQHIHPREEMSEELIGNIAARQLERMLRT